MQCVFSSPLEAKLKSVHNHLKKPTLYLLYIPDMSGCSCATFTSDKMADRI